MSRIIARFSELIYTRFAYLNFFLLIMVVIFFTRTKKKKHKVLLVSIFIPLVILFFINTTYTFSSLIGYGNLNNYTSGWFTKIIEKRESENSAVIIEKKNSEYIIKHFIKKSNRWKEVLPIHTVQKVNAFNDDCAYSLSYSKKSEFAVTRITCSKNSSKEYEILDESKKTYQSVISTNDYQEVYNISNEVPKSLYINGELYSIN